MIESVPHHLVGEAVFVLISVVAMQRGVDQRRQNNQRTAKQDRFHG